MRLQEPLTQENCFNELRAKYPKAMKKFCDWIDEYKEASGYNRLFAKTGTIRHGTPVFKGAPKFHEIPYAMQLGICAEFFTQIIPEYDWSISSSTNLKMMLQEAFAVLEEKLTTDN